VEIPLGEDAPIFDPARVFDRNKEIIPILHPFTDSLLMNLNIMHIQIQLANLRNSHTFQHSATPWPLL
jgi:hypothetical protein